VIAGGVGLLGLLTGILAFANSGCGGLGDLTISVGGNTESVSSGKYTAAAFFIFIAGIFKLSVGGAHHRRRFIEDPNAQGG